MSRAFVKESDGPELVDRPEPALPPGAKNHVTPEGAARFRDRLAAAQAERDGLGASGLDESRRQELDREIRWLERRLATFVVTEAPADPQRVGFGVRVTVTRGAETRRIRIVGVDEVDPAAGDVSWLSPLARALHGLEPGDAATVDAPGGSEEWEVSSIER
jgi:transcription elongation factor GreB